MGCVYDSSTLYVCALLFFSIYFLSHSNRMLGSKVIDNFTSPVYVTKNNKEQTETSVTISYVSYCFHPVMFNTFDFKSP